MALTSGNTLSLYNLGQATGQGTTNISIGTIEGSPTVGENISISSFALGGSGATAGSVGSISGFTYAVENTSETYTLGFTDAGTRFSTISSRGANFTWSVPVGSKISLSSNNGASAVFAVGDMTNAPTQTVLQSILTHTIRAVFADGFNDHAANYNTNRDKTVYSVDSYDGNSTALCLTIDSPVTLADGTIVEAGDLNEGDTLKGFSLGGLSVDSDGTFLEWSTNSLSTTPKDVTIVNLTYSFASRYYDVNNGEVTATAEHPMLVKDSASGDYLFKEMFNLVVGDKLVKGDNTEVDITSIEIVEKTTEIVSIDVESEDTYMVNGYITHNKGGNSHTDLSAPGAPTNVTYTDPNISWTAPASTGTGGITAYEWQIGTTNTFTTITNTADEWSTNIVEVFSLILAGTFWFRVRAIDQGLKGAWSTPLEFTVVS
jgi:hypothetical protein